MKLNNKGFALTSIIYMLIVMFVLVIVLVLSNLAQRKVILDKMKYDVKNKLNQGGVVAQEKYIVTIDSQNGEDPITKQVTYGKPYGKLPTPTREGYKFLGWRNKNLFNMQEWLNSFDSARNGTITKNENSITITATGDDSFTNTYGKGNSYIIKVEPNNTYTLSWKSDTPTSGRIFIFFNNISDTEHRLSANNSSNNSLTFSTPSDTYFIAIRLGVEHNGDLITYSDIQLEKGNKPTTYEPYEEYNDNTIVTTKLNHELYAIWKKTYTIVYNGNGATSGTMENSEYDAGIIKALNSNNFEKTGYTFIGWAINSENQITTLIDDNNEYSYDNSEGTTYADFKSYIVSPPFQEGENYTLMVDVKGNGILNNYYYGANGYLGVKYLYNSIGQYADNFDGNNTINLLNEYNPYHVNFVLGNGGNGEFEKYLLFRLLPGNSASIKNIKLYKTDYPLYINNIYITDYTSNSTITLYAIWKANE